MLCIVGEPVVTQECPRLVVLVRCNATGIYRVIHHNYGGWLRGPHAQCDELTPCCYALTRAERKEKQKGQTDREESLSERTDDSQLSPVLRLWRVWPVIITQRTLMSL